MNNGIWHDIIANQVLWACLVAWGVAQGLKVFVVLIRDRYLDLKYLVRSGGMPSSHTALVCALATAVAMVAGFDSVAFAVAVVVALIVVYDATGVRRSVGRQSVVLNRIVKELMERRPRGEVEYNIRVLLGHTPYQVFAGALLGIFVGWLWIVLFML